MCWWLGAGNRVITATAGNAPRGLDIPIGNGVSVVANTDAASSVSFTAAAKHLQGNISYGSDGDTTSIFQDTVTHGPGAILVAATCPASLANADDFTVLVNWVAK